MSGLRKGEHMTNRTSTEYKTYLAEDELPKEWLNIRAFMNTDHAPILNPATLEPMTVADLEPVFCSLTRSIRQYFRNDFNQR